MSDNRLILLVEDSPDNRGLVQQLVEDWMDLTLIEAEDGATGVELATERQPAVILMDLSLPVLDGWEATRRLKADPATARIPVVALTAHAMAGDEQKARDAGADAYMTKPVDLEALQALIERLMAGGAP